MRLSVFIYTYKPRCPFCPVVTTSVRDLHRASEALIRSSRMRAAGKAVAPAISTDDDDDAATAPLTGRDAQWQAGVRRQALPDAQQQRIAASAAAAAKRSANAMPEDERKAKRRKHAKEVRERQRAERAAVAESAAAEPAAAEPTAEPAAEPVAAKSVGEPATVTPPDLELFNKWLQCDGYALADRDEWQEFEDDGSVCLKMPSPRICSLRRSSSSFSSGVTAIGSRTA